MGSSIRMGLLGIALSFAPASAFAAVHGAKGDPGFHTATAHQSRAEQREDARQGPAKFRLGLSPKARDALADRKRDEVIADLRRIAAKFDDASPQKPDLLLQLSEFYWEKEQYLYDGEMERLDQAWAAYDAAKAKGRAPAEPEADHRESERYRRLAMGIYDRLLTQYPKYARRDEVLFLLGYNLNDLNRGKEAIARYAQLIREFPHSRFVPDAYVQLGNYWFNHDQLAAARGNYEKALRTDVPKIHSYALYKLAWCDYNAGAFDQALAKLHQVVDFAGTRKEMVDLRNEALKDLVVVYTRLDQADAGRAYFEAHAPPEKQAHLIARLADGVAEAGHYDEAIKTYRTLIARAPMGPSAPDYQQAIVHAFEGLRQRGEVKKEIQRLAQLYKPGSAWWRANAKNEEVLRSAFDVSEEAMRQVVTEYHQEAQKTQQVETYKLARDIYREYLDAFASSSDPRWISDQAFNLRFYYAEILWTLEDWAGAAEQYDQVARARIPDRESARSIAHDEYRKTAAFDAILAYDKLVKIERGELSASTLHDGDKVDGSKAKGDVEKGVALAKTPGEGAEQPLTSAEQKLVAACDTYTRLFAGAKDEIEIRYQAAVVFYRRNHFDEAAARFKAIVLKWPEEKRSQEAADLTLHVLESKHDWAGLNQAAREFSANTRLTRPGTEFATRLREVLQGSQYKWVSETLYAKQGDKPRAAEEFLRYASEFPQSPNADRALTYAMLTFQEEGQLDRGIEAGERALQNAPNSPLTLKVRYTLAHLYEGIAQLDRAAEMSESLVTAFDRAKEKLSRERKQAKATPKATAAPASTSHALKGAFSIEERQQLLAEAEPWLPDAQFDAGVWWEGLGKTDRAVADYHAYVKRFPDRKDIPEVAFHIGEAYEQDHRWRESTRAFADFADRYAHDKRASAARRYLALLHQLNGGQALHQNVDALNEALLRGHGRLSATEQQEPEVIAAFGQARFLSAEPSWREFEQVRLNRVSSLRADLLRKQRLLKDLERRYTDVVTTGAGEYAIAALTRLGQGYADFAEAIRHSPTPRGLSGDQAQLYRSELEKLAQPLENRAVEVLQQGLGKAYELGIYGSWTLAAQDALDRYRPGLYPPIREVPYREDEKAAPTGIEQERAAAPAPVALETAPASAR